MPVYQPIALWIAYSKIWQYLKGNINAKIRIFRGGAVVPDYDEVLRWVRTSVEWAYNNNPNDTTLNNTSAYMISLVDVAKAKLILSGTSTCISPVFTINPTSQSISSGGSATFTALAVGTGTISYQWQLNGVNINGATGTSYTTPSVTTGGNYRVLASNTCGSAASSSAILTVNQPQIQFTIGWSPNPLFVDNSTPLVIPNSQVISFTPGANLIYSGNLVPFANMYVGWAFPASEPTPTSWSNGDPATSINKGVIPDFTMLDVYTVGAIKYLACRNPIVLNTSLDLRLLH